MESFTFQGFVELGEIGYESLNFWLIKSIGGVVLRDFLLVFDERCNRSDLWKKSA